MLRAPCDEDCHDFDDVATPLPNNYNTANANNGNYIKDVIPLNFAWSFGMKPCEGNLNELNTPEPTLEPLAKPAHTPTNLYYRTDQVQNLSASDKFYFGSPSNLNNLNMADYNEGGGIFFNGVSSETSTVANLTIDPTGNNGEYSENAGNSGNHINIGNNGNVNGESDADAVIEVVKRGRGRPRKYPRIEEPSCPNVYEIVTEAQASTSNNTNNHHISSEDNIKEENTFDTPNDGSDEVIVKRGKGRPRKHRLKIQCKDGLKKQRKDKSKKKHCNDDTEEYLTDCLGQKKLPKSRLFEIVKDIVDGNSGILRDESASAESMFKHIQSLLSPEQLMLLTKRNIKDLIRCSHAQMQVIEKLLSRFKKGHVMGQRQKVVELMGEGMTSARKAAVATGMSYSTAKRVVRRIKAPQKVTIVYWPCYVTDPDQIDPSNLQPLTYEQILRDTPELVDESNDNSNDNPYLEIALKSSESSFESGNDGEDNVFRSINENGRKDPIAKLDSIVVKRPRGRPRKYPLDVDAIHSNNSDEVYYEDEDAMNRIRATPTKNETKNPKAKLYDIVKDILDQNAEMFQDESAAPETIFKKLQSILTPEQLMVLPRDDLEYLIRFSPGQRTGTWKLINRFKRAHELWQREKILEMMGEGVTDVNKIAIAAGLHYTAAMRVVRRLKSPQFVTAPQASVSHEF